VYDYKNVVRETVGNGIEDLRDEKNRIIRDDAYRNEYNKLANSLVKAYNKITGKLGNETAGIILKDGLGAIPTIAELDGKCKRMTAVINTFYVDFNNIIDSLNNVKENWGYIHGYVWTILNRVLLKE
jgi:hypothetical protein